MKKTITSLACLFTFSLGWSQATKVLTAEKSNDYGLVYSLPVTALEVEVTARHDVAKKGPYYPYAKKSIGTDKAIGEDYEKWTITDVKVRPYGVSDSSTQYLMQLRPGALTSITVDADGMLLAINKEVAPSEKASQPAASTQNVKWPTGNEYLEFVDEDFVASKSSAKQAQLLAESLMEVRDAKLALTRGTADVMPADGKQMELMLNSLGAQEAAITAAFTGTVTTEYVTRHFTYVPEGKDSKEVLFRMSEFAGFVDADDLSGDPVNIEIETINDVQLPVDAKGEPKKLPKNAVIYNIPGSAQVTISALGKKLYEKEIQMAQTGMTFGLDPLLFTDKKEPSYAVFDPVTGALLELRSIPAR